MGTKSAFTFPERFWLVEEPPHTQTFFQLSEVFAEVGAWETRPGLRIAACKGGAFVFDFAKIQGALAENDPTGSLHFSRLIGATQERVKLINSFALCLHSARIEKEEFASDGYRIDHRSLFHLNNDDVSSGLGGPGLMTLQPVPGLGFARDPYRMGAVPKASISAACELLDHLMASTFKKALELTVLINDSLASLKNHDFASSLITSWTVCETLLQHHWTQYFTTTGTSKNSARRQKLLGRDFTASVVSEILELAGVLDGEILHKLDTARRARNSWMHSIKPPSYEDSIAALELSSEMLGNVVGRRVRVAPSVFAAVF